MSGPTATPWATCKAKATRSGDRGPDVAILGPNQELLAEIYNRVTDYVFADNEANAELIVRAVNTHRLMLESLEEIVDGARECESCDGTGLLPRTDDDACGACGGTGEYAIVATVQDLRVLIAAARGEARS